MLSRRQGLGLVFVALLAGCDKLKGEASSSKKSDDKDEDDDKKKKDKKKDGEGEKSAAPKAEEVSPEVQSMRKAYALGKAWGYACIFSTLGQPPDVTRNMTKVDASAKDLGIEAPKAPTKEAAMGAMRAPAVSDALTKKHGAKVAAAFGLGRDMADIFFGAMLGADVSPVCASIEKGSAAATVPEDVWKTKLAAVKAGANDKTSSTLTKAFDAHFHHVE